MSTRLFRLAAVAVALATVRTFISGPSNLLAGIVAMTGSAAQIAAPPSVLGGALESNTVTNFFMEQPLITLDSDLDVDVMGPGRVRGRLELRPGVIAAGTTLTSYLLHQDRVGEDGMMRLKGSIRFDGPILGLILLHGGLNETDELLGNDSTTYPTGVNQRQFELRTDIIRISDNQTRLIYNLQTTYVVDHVRILVGAPVPGPAAAGLFALAGCAFAPRRRRA